MTQVLLDTHAWAWTMTGDAHLSVKAREAIERADTVFVSPVSLSEIGQKVRIGKWPEMEPYTGRLIGLVEEQGGLYAHLTPAIYLNAAMLAWPHRDPFDRILAQTALGLDLHLVSADSVFDELSNHAGWRGRIW